MRGITHELLVAVRRTPERLRDDPDFVPQPSPHPVAPGTRVEVRDRRWGADGPTVVFVTADEDCFPDAAYAVRAVVNEGARTYVALDLVERPWNRDAAGPWRVARLLDPDTLLALAPEEVAPLRSRFAAAGTPTRAQVEAALGPFDAGSTPPRPGVADGPDRRPLYRSGCAAIEAAVGGEFAILVQDLPSTGYRWRWGEPFDERVIESRGWTSPGPAPGAPEPPGATRDLQLNFRAVGVGETSIVLHHVPPAGGEPRTVLRFAVKVAPGPGWPAAGR